jgi:two-component system, NtrC family, response regulator HupR/HoxA
MRKSKILIVEDTINTMNSLKKLLLRKNYEVDAFPNTTNVLQNVKKRIYDLAIIDIVIEDEPRKGLELAKEIRDLQNQKVIPTIGIFILTVNDTYENAFYSINDFQADSFIVKSEEDDLLLEEISKYLKKKEFEILNDPVVKAFENWVNLIDPDDFTIQTLDDDEKVVSYNAQQILEQMISQTEFGVNFMNSISSGTQELIFSSMKKNK